MVDQESRDDAGGRASDARESGRPPRARDAAARKPRASGDRKPYGNRDSSDRKPYGNRDSSDRKPYGNRDNGDRKPYGNRDTSDRKPYGPRASGDRKPYGNRDSSDRKPYGNRDSSDRKPYGPRASGDRKPYGNRDSSDRKPYGNRDSSDRKPYGNRDSSDRKPYGGGDRKPRPDRPTRGGAGRPGRATRPEEIRPVRPRHDDPVIPEEVTAKDLNPGARNELKTLSKENAEQVARHLVMASELIDDDPELAHQHALSASRRAGRIAIVRETLAITAYATGDYALALRELRTYRRISGRDDQIALMVDSERGVGRPDRALEVGRSVDRASLPTDVRVGLAIAMSGARLDLGEPERALLELDIPELDPDRAFEWSPALFAARATVLEELGRDDEATRWRERAEVAADAIDAATGGGDHETIFIDEIIEVDDEEGAEPHGADEERSHEHGATEPETDDVRTPSDQAGELPAAGDAASDSADPVSVADEVAEILAEAGIDGAPAAEAPDEDAASDDEVTGTDEGASR
ncbi:primosomal protein [Microbacterium sp. NPDC057407]|uniref:primosomal protein n=1 Tax=Microbacterium sp. NPDC057407 TaxID=3346120 RepID=UPI00366AE823